MAAPESADLTPVRITVESEQDWWAGMRALPTLPSVLFRFLGLVGDPNVTTADLTDFIWKDPALLSRALPLIAPGGERSEEQENSLHDGVAALSRERIRNLAFTTPLLRSFEPLGTTSYAITFWERSLLCATASQAAARHLKLANPERCYVAGLLHDLGYLVLLQKRPTILPAILHQWVRRPAHLLDIEEELMGINHCRLGLQAAVRLGLGGWLHPSIGAHHSATRDSDPICRITAVGAALASYQGVDFFPRRSLSPAVRERELEEIIAGLFPEVSKKQRGHLREEMGKAVLPIRHAIREMIVDWQVAGDSKVQPQFTRLGSLASTLPALA